MQVAADVAAGKKRQKKEQLAGEEKRSTEATLGCILTAIVLAAIVLRGAESSQLAI